MKSIKSALTTLCLCAGLIMLIMAGTFGAYVYMAEQGNQRHAEVSALADSLSDVEHGFLSMEQLESQYLFSKAPQTAEDLQKAVEETSARLLDAREVAKDLGLDATLPKFAILHEGLSNYWQTFESIVETSEDLGLDENSGLQGRLRAAIHDAEAILGEIGNFELTTKMLMMRRHEKDFILRYGAQKYLDRHDARVEEFAAFGASHFDSDARRDQVLDLITTYSKRFHVFAEAFRAEQDLRKELDRIVGEGRPIFSELSETLSSAGNVINETVDQESHRFALIGGAVVAVAVLAFVSLATVIVRRIISPLTRLVREIGRLRKGDFAVKFPDAKMAEIYTISASLAALRDTAVEAENMRAAEKERREQADMERFAREKERKENERRIAEANQTSTDLRKAQEAERVIAREIGAVVDACAQGNFKQRLSVNDVDGVIGDLARGVNQIGEVAERNIEILKTKVLAIESGDYERQSLDGTVGVFTEMGKALNSLSASLEQVVSQVSQSSDGVRSLSREISQSASSLSDRTERSAATLEEVAAAVQLLTNSVSTTAQNAETTLGSVSTAASRAEKTFSISNRAVEAMERIGESSSEISKINSLIDTIAFQTNLLALNAGVEAARAGEAGKGFAVVATEVRELAQRSSEAARDINALIERSISDVQNGTELVSESQVSVSEIQTTVEEVSKQVSEIVAANRDQSANINEINASITNLDQVSQKNAAMFEETAAACSQLDSEAAQLETCMRQLAKSKPQPPKSRQDGAEILDVSA